MFFSPGLVFGLMQFIIHVERMRLPGPEKKKAAITDIERSIKDNPGMFGTSALNPAIPWATILPVLIDCIIKIINELFGKKWIEEIDNGPGEGG